MEGADQHVPWFEPVMEPTGDMKTSAPVYRAPPCSWPGRRRDAAAGTRAACGPRPPPSPHPQRQEPWAGPAWDIPETCKPKIPKISLQTTPCTSPPPPRVCANCTLFIHTANYTLQFTPSSPCVCKLCIIHKRCVLQTTASPSLH